MKKHTKVQLVWFVLLLVGLATFAGKIINQALAGYGLEMLFVVIAIVLPLIVAMIWLCSQIFEERTSGFIWLWLFIATIYQGVFLGYDYPRTFVIDNERVKKERRASKNAPPRRFIDKEAQVVCYESRELDGDKPTLACLPLSSTALKLQE